jgi:hypothetical protein
MGRPNRQQQRHSQRLPVTVGQKRETILQTAGEDFNNRMWFDGVDDNLDLDSNQSFSGAFTWSFKLLLSSTATAQVIFADSSVNNIYVRTNVTASVFEFRIGGSAASVFFDSNLESGTLYDIQISRDISDVITVVVDGVTQLDDAKTLTGTFIVNRFGMRNAAFNPLGGLLYDVNLGNGLEWDGTIADGNTIGTVNGSPSLYHVAESETTAGQDALGNAIENPRPNERVLNLTTGTGYAEIADSDSLDLTTEATWELWGNFADKQTNNQEAYLAKYNAGGNKRSWNIAYNPVNQNPDEISMAFGDPSDGTFEGLVKISVPNEIASVVFTYNNGTLVAYVNGSSVGKTVVAGSVPVTLHQNNEPVLVGSSGDDLPAARLIGDIRIYDRALTADEVLKNYNARKGAYGL